MPQIRRKNYMFFFRLDATISFSQLLMFHEADKTFQAFR